MKMKPEHYKMLKESIIEAAPNIDFAGLKANIAADPRVKDAHKRYVWDIFYSIPFPTRLKFLDEVYEYLDDTHIPTALEKIIKELNL